MPEIKDIIVRFADIAEDVLPLVAGDKGKAAVEIGHGLIGLADTVRVTVGQDAPPLAAKLPAPQAAVIQHADETATGLRGSKLRFNYRGRPELRRRLSSCSPVTEGKGGAR